MPACFRFGFSSHVARRGAGGGGLARWSGLKKVPFGTKLDVQLWPRNALHVGQVDTLRERAVCLWPSRDAAAGPRAAAACPDAAASLGAAMDAAAAEIAAGDRTSSARDAKGLLRRVFRGAAGTVLVRGAGPPTRDLASCARLLVDADLLEERLAAAALVSEVRDPCAAWGAAR